MEFQESVSAVMERYVVYRIDEFSHVCDMKCGKGSWSGKGGYTCLTISWLFQRELVASLDV